MKLNPNIQNVTERNSCGATLLYRYLQRAESGVWILANQEVPSGHSLASEYGRTTLTQFNYFRECNVRANHDHDGQGTGGSDLLLRRRFVRRQDRGTKEGSPKQKTEQCASDRSIGD